VGYRAGYSLTGADSDDNTFIGKEAGHTVTTGSDNTLIGSDTTTSAVDAVNQIVIGYDATGLGNNYAVIGNGDITRVYAADDTGATLYAGSATVSTSDSRIKEDVKDTMLGLSFINKLRSVEYKKRQPSDYDESLKKKLDWYKNNKTPRTLDELDKNKIRTGFIAQEVGKILKDMGIDVNTGEESTSQIQMSLAELEQEKTIKTAEKAALQTEITEIGKMITQIKKV
jgi:Ca2+-binding RTX toxin-like protein